MAAVAAIANDATQTSGWFLIVALLVGILSLLQYVRLGGYAQAQIEQISANGRARAEVKGIFNAL